MFFFLFTVVRTTVLGHVATPFVNAAPVWGSICGHWPFHSKQPSAQETEHGNFRFFGQKYVSKAHFVDCLFAAAAKSLAQNG